MPQRLTVSEARRIAASNEHSRSRGRGADNRLEPECWPALSPKFTFEPGSSLFTIGSCFARNIEHHMHALGFRLPTMQIDPKHANSTAPDPKGNRVRRINSLLNKYTPPSIYQELKWTSDILLRDDTMRESDCDPLFLGYDGGKVIDLHIFPIEPVERDLAIERRRVVYDVFRQAFSAEIVVITLGLIETWVDLKNNLYALQLPDRELTSPSGRFRFERLTFAQCHDFLCRALDLLDAAGPKKHLLTTSPVVLGRTFTRDDIIVANMYSKSVLRAVAGQVSIERENVDYFPSFESVVLTKQNYVWLDDLTHVSESFVRRIVDRVAVAYAGQAAKDGGPQLKVTGITETAARFTDVMLSGDETNAAHLFDAIESDPLAVKDGTFHVAAALLMQVKGDRQRAVEHAGLALRMPNISAWNRFRLVDVLRWGGDDARAERLLESIIARATVTPTAIAVIGNRLVGRGESARAIDLFEAVSQRIGTDPVISHFLARLYGQAGRRGDAIGVLQQVTAAFPALAHLHFLLGTFLLPDGNGQSPAAGAMALLDEAITALERAVELDPANEQYRSHLARALRIAGQPEKADEITRGHHPSSPHPSPA
jgi:tetratricopeptide (TPR) repeat protein